MQRVVKPKTQRGRRALDKKEPKIFENPKTALFFKGGNTSQTVTQALKEWHILKKPYSTMFTKKNVTRPFEDQSSVEFFSSKADSSLFMFGCHSKKRPNNLVIGRIFDGQVLDMAEFGIEEFVSMNDVEGKKLRTGMKPCLTFSGDDFEDSEELRRVKNLLIDFFRGPELDQVCLTGLEHVIHIHRDGQKIFIRNYKVLLKKSGSKIPRVELESLGLSLDLIQRRTRLASDDLFKRALKKPATAKPKKKKNISLDDLGNRLGRVHMKTQDMSKLQARKLKGLKKSKRPLENDQNAEEESTDANPAKRQKSQNSESTDD